MPFAFTRCFELQVLPRRPNLTRAMCIRVVRHPACVELQPEGNRVRFWEPRPENQAMRIEHLPETDSLYIELGALDLRRVPFGAGHGA